MKKHTGWNKVMLGVVRSPTNNTQATQNSTRNSIMSPSTMLNQQQQLGVKTTKNSDTKKRLLKEPIGENDKSKSTKEEEIGYLKSKSVSIHPFYQSLVTQNFELLAKQLKYAE